MSLNWRCGENVHFEPCNPHTIPSSIYNLHFNRHVVRILNFNDLSGYLIRNIGRESLTLPKGLVM